MWLLGLLLVPVIRWLHRGGRHRNTVPVSHLGLWRGSAANSPVAGERRPPDPAWRRRALLAAMLFVALGGPQWPGRRIHVTLWIDDSLSMLTREAQGTRLALGLAQARARLAEVAPADVDVRTLGDPWHSLGTLDQRSVATLLAEVAGKVPAPPPTALLRRDGQHWLVTDGAHAALFAWPDDHRPDRIIQVGSVTRNVGLERLSARRSASDPGKLDLLLKLTNGGNAAETRELVLFTDAGEVARSAHHIEPGTSAFVNATILASTSVRAALEPGDALPEDDEIVLDLAPLRRQRVAIDSTCPRALVAAVSAHPALVVAKDGATDVQAALDCGERGAANGLATVRVIANSVPTRPRGPVEWSSSVAESARIRLHIDRMRVAARLRARPGDTVLLALDGEPVIVSRSGASRLIETSLDFESMVLAGGPEIPLLVNLMFEHLLGSRLLDQIAVADRGPQESWVTPSKPVATMVAARHQSGARVLREGTRWLLAAALLVLIWEIIALWRQGYRLVD
jgi:hypothetical protein